MTEHLGQRRLPPDPEIPAHLQATKWRITYECEVCGHRWKRTTTKLARKDPPCPTKACKELEAACEAETAAENIEAMLEEQRPPGHIGDKPIVKAIDTTAQIVMEDHGMTDLRDNIREGETMAPKLPGDQQVKADNFFRGSAHMGGQNKRAERQAQMLKMAAINGSFAGMAMDPQRVLGRKTGESALRYVGTRGV